MSSIISQKRGGLALFSSPKHVDSHYLRLVCHAKGLEDLDFVEIDNEELHKELLEINPNGKLPTLIDRDLTLYDARVIAEYVDERFPHPALMPIEANLRARIRLFFWEIEKHWYTPINTLEHSRITAQKKKPMQKELRDSILRLNPYFKGQQFLVGNELSLLDCCILPALWRLGALEIELPKAAQYMIRYMNTHFEKDYFRSSLSRYEQSLPPVTIV
ncbi:MAG: glutathione S-transferase N-terminal domain-containing protein [Cardiobacteriaceae bacterium]|nr:glutathione S-transferase N-terminal domain-containing protein [Cardiobacteriaceae bacterium]